MPRAGIEPARLHQTQDFESSASTNSATGANGLQIYENLEFISQIYTLHCKTQRRRLLGSEKEMNILELINSYQQVFVVCDRNVESFARKIGDYPLLPFHACEQNKTIDTVVSICRWLMENGADRKALLLAVGGGTTTDVVGFAASIYKRGIAYVNIPTTLLGMIDAGVGGKTGVNLDSYKNMLGSFKLPEFIWLYPEVLRSLPHREFLSGAAEMLKTFIISDRNGSYARAVRLFSKYASDGVSPVENADGLKELSALIQEASDIKQDIVEKDPFEKGDRSKLNLGHTWAHAIEWWKPGAYTHGEAVAIGIIQAARKAEELALTQKGAAGKHGLTQKGLADRLKEDFTACGLPTELPCAESELLPAMRCDKKANGGSIRFVLPVSIGKVIVKSIPL